MITSPLDGRGEINPVINYISTKYELISAPPLVRNGRPLSYLLMGIRARTRKFIEMAVLKNKKIVCPAFDQNRKTPPAVKVTETTLNQTFYIHFKSFPVSRVSGNGSEYLSKVPEVNIMAAVLVQCASKVPPFKRIHLPLAATEKCLWPMAAKRPDEHVFELIPTRGHKTQSSVHATQRRRTTHTVLRRARVHSSCYRPKEKYKSLCCNLWYFIDLCFSRTPRWETRSHFTKETWDTATTITAPQAPHTSPCVIHTRKQFFTFKRIKSQDVLVKKTWIFHKHASCCLVLFQPITTRAWTLLDSSIWDVQAPEVVLNGKVFINIPAVPSADFFSLGVWRIDWKWVKLKAVIYSNKKKYSAGALKRSVKFICELH